MHQKSWRSYFHGAVLCMVFCFLFIQACTHDSTVDPVDPGPDPIDTTGNPTDTTDMGIPCDPDVIYFDLEILPILRSNCAKSGCHDAITHKEDIILDSYQNVMGSNVIKPLDLEDSELFEKITENDPDKVMPPPPNQRLSNEQIGLIAAWILQGAKNETCDENPTGCNTINVTYSGFVSPLLVTNCVGCHSGGAPSGGITLNAIEGVRTVALNGRLFGAISHAPSYEPMPFAVPKGSVKLPQCSIDKIKKWIDDGAQNN